MNGETKDGEITEILALPYSALSPEPKSANGQKQHMLVEVKSRGFEYLRGNWVVDMQYPSTVPTLSKLKPPKNVHCINNGQ